MTMRRQRVTPFVSTFGLASIMAASAAICAAESLSDGPLSNVAQAFRAVDVE